MTKRETIQDILNTMEPSKAIALIESIGKERRKANSIIINTRRHKRHIDSDSPDLVQLKKK